MNDSWSSGWVTPPSGSAWVDAGTGKTAAPPGWLVNYDAESLDTPIAWVDPYIYQSFFLDLKSNLVLHKELYDRSSYYSSRLPWLLLGNAVYSVAPPETANLLLHLLLFYVAIFSLYITVRLATRNDLAALIAALLLGVNTYFLWSIGWNYVDGFGVTLILVMLAGLTQAATSQHWKPVLLLGGMAAATAVSINIFLVTAMPCALAWYLLLNHEGPRHRLAASVALIIAGGAIAIAAFGLINQYLTADPFYWVPQISWLISSHNPSRRDLYPEAGWLVVPGAAAALSFLFLLTRGYLRLFRRPSTEGESLGAMCAAVFLMTLGTYTYLEFFSASTVMEHPFYVSYLLPFAYLVFGVAAHVVSVEHPVSDRVRGFVVCCVFLCLLAPFAVHQLRFMPGCPDGCLSSGGLHLLVVPALVLMAIAVFMRSAPSGLALLLVFSLVNVGVADRHVLTFSRPEREAMHERSAMVFDTEAVVLRHNEKRDMRFWIDLRDPYGWVYSAVAGQNLWNKRLVSLEFPAVRPNMELTAGDRVMLASAGGDDVVLRANQALSPRALHLEVFEQSRIQRGTDGFDVFLTTVKPGASVP